MHHRLKPIVPLISALIAVFALACGSGGPPASPASTPNPASFPGDTWQLTYDVSGGFDGRNYSLVLASSGAATVEDKRARLSATRTIAPAEVTKVANLLAGSGVNGPQPARNGGCADCIDMAVTVVTGGQTYKAAVNQINAQPRLDLLMAELQKLYDANGP